MFKRSWLKKILFRAAPHAAEAMQIIWQRHHIRRFERRLALPALARSFTARHGYRVLAGPFQGMAYVPQAVGSALVPKLVGSYEQELKGALHVILQTPYDVVVDVGCAEGYYAVGLARTLRETQVYAFDIDQRGRQLCQAMARKNGVLDRVQVRARCDCATLQGLLSGRSLVLSDCEGYEWELLQPAHAPGLRNADILVELHDHIRPDFLPQLVSRFETTHTIDLIESVPRDGCHYDCLAFLPVAQRHLAVNEFRPSLQRWAFLVCRNAPAGHAAVRTPGRVGQEATR